jgi:hypothetical protein
MSPNPTMTPSAKAFLGSWELESFTEQAEASDIVHPLGENATGFSSTRKKVSFPPNS